MIEKVLIANRGEIAVRIIRACRELGISTLAVYSEADEQSAHVHLADSAICIGPNSALQSYLKSDRILSAAEVGDVDAIHPGYGFLSENALFAEQCESCNIKFIGPSPKTIRMMGDKALARETAQKAKCPIVPGEGPIDSEREALKIAQKIGFPVIIKALAGGGGKGMRLAHNAASFTKEYTTARIEAEKAFGNSAVYLEKFIQNPRHIEFQILADAHGNIVHLGERDCSIQRRYQKLVEESPSPFLTPKLREKMGEAAIRVARACNYQNAGTIEFLVDEKGNFYFIEMNTRIQVEHGVTEEVTGIDLVKQQLLIARGEKLPFRQKDIKFEKHAIECRINAEDPQNNFVPACGEIELLCQPGGPGVRLDSHIYGGYKVPHHYDSMIAKVITFGHSRELAIDRMQRALQEFIIKGPGLSTTIPFCRAIMLDPVFRSGLNITTSFIPEFFARTPKTIFEPNQKGISNESVQSR